jgi:hypothetical protein
MPIETHDKILKNSKDEDVKVITSNFPAIPGLKLGIRIVKFLGGFLKMGSAKVPVSLNENKPASVFDADVNFDKIAEVLTKHLDDDRIVKLIIDLMAYTRVNGKEVAKEGVFNLEFAGEYGLLIQVVKFVVEVNFTTFFDKNAIGNILERIKALFPMAGDLLETETLQQSSGND